MCKRLYHFFIFFTANQSINQHERIFCTLSPNLDPHCSLFIFFGWIRIWTIFWTFWKVSTFSAPETKFGSAFSKGQVRSCKLHNWIRIQNLFFLSGSESGRYSKPFESFHIFSPGIQNPDPNFFNWSDTELQNANIWYGSRIPFFLPGSESGPALFRDPVRAGTRRCHRVLPGGGLPS